MTINPISANLIRNGRVLWADLTWGCRRNSPTTWTYNLWNEIFSDSRIDGPFFPILKVIGSSRVHNEGDVWFASESYQLQDIRGLVECPTLSDHTIRRKLIHGQFPIFSLWGVIRRSVVHFKSVFRSHMVRVVLHIYMVDGESGACSFLRLTAQIRKPFDLIRYVLKAGHIESQPFSAVEVADEDYSSGASL